MFHRSKKMRPHNQILFTLLIALAVIGVWRGAKGLMDLYLFPTMPTLSYSLSVAIGLIILYSTHYWTKELA